MTTFGGKQATFLLFFGDLIVFVLSLWATLVIRYVEVPSTAFLISHLIPFSLIFIVWIVVFYMAGLYGKRVVLFKKELPGAIIAVQVVNVLLAALFFFFVPLGITPKASLLLYLVVSVIGIFAWRLWVFPRITKPTKRERVALIGEGKEVEELMLEVNSNARYHMEIVTVVSLRTDPSTLHTLLADSRVSTLVVDTECAEVAPLLPVIYELAFVSPGYHFLDFYQVYEEVFDRVPLSLLRYEWFLKHATAQSSGGYEFIKRLIDVVGGLLMLGVTLVALPFVFVALRLEGKGSLFITQERIGQFGSRVRTYKFRSMKNSDDGKWKGEGENYVTRVGSVLRLTSLDEFPQCINVLRGELSLIGPRNDIRALGERLASSIPYYSIRYMVKPGITGWAQINQQYEQGNISPQSIEETKTRLAYDFYYIKKRSLVLDIVIALKTVKRMFFRVSSW